MIKNRWRPALAGLALVLVLFCEVTRAFGSPRFNINHWDTGDGLPEQVVLSILQTGDGYLWLGTLKGLARFDGVQFERFSDANTPALRNTTILRLFEDSRGNLWIGTQKGGIILVDRKGAISKVELGSDARDASVVSICEDSAGAVFLGLSNGQVYTWIDGKAGILMRGGQQVISENSGKIWVVTPGNPAKLLGIRLAQGSAPTVAALEDELTVNEPQFLLASKKGGFWVLADGKVQKHRGATVERVLGAFPWRSQVYCACEDGAGNLIVGTQHEGVFWFEPNGGGSRISGAGIFRFDDKGILGQNAAPTARLGHDTILSVAVDREGSLWVGTDGSGLNRVRREIFEAAEEGSNVKSICADRDGGVWIASGDDLVHLKEGQRMVNRVTNQEPLAVFVDHEHKTWVGMRHGEYGAIFQAQGDSFRLAAPPGPGWISVIHEDKSNRLWFGSQAGLICRERERWRVYTVKDGLSANNVQAIADDPEGNIWVGTEGGGLNRFQDGRFNAISRTNGLPSENVSSLYIDSDGVLWAGTSGGLGRFANGQWTRFARDQGLINEDVGYILEDDQGYLWLGSTAGLTRAEKRQLNAYSLNRTNELFLRIYGEAEGLPSAECSPAAHQPAACRTRDGKLWFPTIKGVATITLASLAPNTNPPPVRIDYVLLDTERQPAPGLDAPPLSQVVVPANRESIEIHYTSLNLSAPLKGRFKYRMENHESTWTEKSGEVRFARYPKLPPGDYKFEVRAANEDNVWDTAGASIRIKVLPPFWKTWWFRSVVAAAILGLVIGSVYYVSTQNLQRQLASLRQQEAIERERARIARDLHDQLGANLTQVALLGEMAETDKDVPQEVEAHARQISQTARETTHALDEIVWTVNPSNDTLDGLINYICKYAQEYFALADLRYRLEVPAQLPTTPISPELRHNVFLAAKECVNNIVKHARASSAWLRLHLEPGRFTLEIEDNGKGLDPDAEKKGRSGLRNMRKRMEDVSGEFSIGPGSEGGTRIRLTAPLNTSPTPKT
jgi:signal transduction histidine kinase/ligand-binding sensor domain-containing protein